MTISILTGVLALAQDKPAPSAARKPSAAAATADSPVDNVIQLSKGGMSEALIIKTLQRQNKPMNLSTADMLKLQKAGVSDNIIGVMMDPTAAPSAAAPAPSIAKPVQTQAPQTAPAATEARAQDCPAPAGVSAAANSAKRRLAVAPFDYSAVQTQVTAMFNNNVNIGQGIRAMLTTKMAQSKSVVLLEREKLKAVMAEQDFGATNRVKRGSAPAIGGVTGADAMLFGDIVIFGRDDQGKHAAAGGGGYIGGPLGGVIGGMRNARQTDKAVVAINLRIVDAVSGEVLDSAEARGESSRTSTNWGAIAGSWRGGAAGSEGMTSSNFQETIIGEATQDAVNKIAAFIEQKMPQIAAKSRTIEGRVANLDGCTLYLSVGGNDGVHVGDRFEILRIVKEITDPETKEVIDTQTEKMGDMVVSTVRDKMAVGQYGGPGLSAAYIGKPGYAARMATQ